MAGVSMRCVSKIRVLRPVLVMLLASACAPTTPVFETAQASATATDEPQSTSFDAALRMKGRAAGAQFLAAITPIMNEDSPRLLGTALRGDAISAERTVASRTLRPSLTLGGSTVSEAMSLTVSQPLFEFGKRGARLERLKSLEDQQRLQLADARQSLAEQALTAAIAQDLAKKWIAVTQRRIADFRKAKANALRMADLQLIMESDVQLVEVKLNEATSDLARAQNDLLSAQRSWARLAGTAPFPDAPLFPDLLNRFGTGTAKSAHMIAAQNNLDLRLLQAEIAVQHSEVSVVKTGRRPTLSVQNITKLDSGNDLSNNVGLGLEVDLFSPDRDASIARAEGMSNALAADLVNMREDLTFEIERLLSEAAAADRLATEKTRSLQALEARVTALERQLEQGLATFTDLIDARSDLFEVQYEALTLQNDAQLRQADVLVKTGAFAY